MAGTWLAVVKGFGGMRVENNQLLFTPYCPDGWNSFAFKIRFRGTLLQITTTQDDVTVDNFSGQPITLQVRGEALTVAANSRQSVAVKEAVAVSNN